MDPAGVLEAIGGGALLFFVPGYAVAKATFPERRLAGPGRLTWGLELVALAFVLSVTLTVAVGYLLLAGAPGGFSATWHDPLLEAGLAAVALAAFAVGLFEGAYARIPPRPRTASSAPGEAGAWELGRDLDRLRERRTVVVGRRDRTPTSEAAVRQELEDELAAIDAEEEALRRRREAEYEL